MVSNNIINPVIESINKNNGEEINKTITNYKLEENIILPSEIQTVMKGDSNNIRTDITFDKYNSKGNIIYYTLLDGSQVIYIWGYSNNLPIAEIRGTTYGDLKEIISEADMQAIGNRITPTNADFDIINNLRNNAKIQMITYTYDPYRDYFFHRCERGNDKILL